MQDNDNNAVFKMIKFHKSSAYKWIIIGLVTMGLLTGVVYFGDIKGFETTIFFSYFIIFILTFKQVLIEVREISYWKKHLT